MDEEGWRDRLASLSRGEMLGLALLVGATLVGAGLWYVRSLPRPVEVRAAVDRGEPSAGASPPPASVLVHVAGWVRHPGVYELREGDRVVDALDAAGGPRRGANLDGLNLAAPVADGAQVLVPRRVEPASGVPAGERPRAPRPGRPPW